MKEETNSGDDIAGIVHKVGSNVYEFKPGDRVASFHEMRTTGGSFAEYALGWQHTTFHLPKKVSFEGKDWHAHVIGTELMMIRNRCRDFASGGHDGCDRSTPPPWTS
jgi:NADPH:quinone reductase-like Zn-dependent oxidoreductase